MSGQPELPFVEALMPPISPEGRSGPRLWVRRLVIFRDRQTVIRDISLKPGLNIIWTPDMSSSGALAHGSGKTTFCRLLRACLGEQGFATKGQRERLVSHLPDGFFAAEVLIDGVCWVAVRSLGMSGNDYVAQVDSIEEVIERGHQPGDHKVIDPLVISSFFSVSQEDPLPEVGLDRTWDIFRAWLTRDQECRLADILAWRSSRTQTHSRAQELGQKAKLAMVRLALRALDPQERAAATREQELKDAIEAELRLSAYQKRRYEEDLKAVRQALGVGDDVGFEDAIDQKGLLSLAKAKLADAMRGSVSKAPDITSIFARRDELEEEHRALTEERQKLHTEATIKREKATGLRSEADLGEIDISQGKVKVCPVCRIRVDDALAKGCGISLEPCDLSARRAEITDQLTQAETLDGEATVAEQTVQRIKVQIQELASRRRVLKKEAEVAQKAIQAASAMTEEAQTRVYEARRTLDDVRSLHDATPALRSGASSNPEMEKVREQLDAGRRRAQGAIKVLEDKYQAIMTAWLPAGVTGLVRLDGHGLEIDAEFSGRGEVSTAALDSLKIVAFDLAALHMAAEEKADLPAFLIHDSPREADLDGRLYERLFELVSQWERASGTPPFQYIVTTTTAPPPELQGAPYTRLEMRSTPSEQRLFRVDL